MYTLYPLKFKTVYKDKIWGGKKIKEVLGKDYEPLPNCGETWELCGIDEQSSVVSNGFLAENELNELIEVYMDDLVGGKVHEQFGNEFPLLIKFIDANDKLSIQVHPDDELAMKRHKCNGKTEMWYVLQADKGAKLISGFNSDINKDIYLKHLQEDTLPEILNFEEVNSGDVFFIPAGRVHAIMEGILLAEIQQSSDITYRIHDWNRLDDKGQPRELHTDLALDAIDYKFHDDYKTHYHVHENETNTIVESDYFTTNIIVFDKEIKKDYQDLDSFVIYICVEGNFEIKYEDKKVECKKSEVILVPAEIKEFILSPKVNTRVLEVYIE